MRLRRWRTPIAVLACFVCSALLTAAVSATIGGSPGSYNGDAGDNSAVGSPGTDVMRGFAGADYFRGGAGSDQLTGDEGDDTMIGDGATDAAGLDVISGNAGGDELAGGGGNDQIYAGDGDDVVGSIDFSQVGGEDIAETGGDALYGQAGNDLIDGGAGNDLIEGGADRDSLYGEGDDDELDPGAGEDYVAGGAGIDRLRYATLAHLTINMSTGTTTGDGTDTFTGIENVSGGSGADVISGALGPNLLNGSDGPDGIDGGPGADVLTGGTGDDELYDREEAGAGDTVNGNDGDDYVDVQNGLVNTVDCGENSNATADADYVLADAQDVVSNCETVDTTPGGQSTVTVSVGGAGSGTVTGQGISCPGDCTQTYATGTVVALQASPGSGSSFAGWGGECSGTGACSVTMNGDRAVSAGFGVVTTPVDPPPPVGDTTAPDTTIVSGPAGKVKSKRRTKSVSFGFSSNEQGSTFECKLDGAGFAPCASPKGFRVGKGPHTFAVIAIDAAGNRDASPATRTFKVVKKKRKGRGR